MFFTRKVEITLPPYRLAGLLCCIPWTLPPRAACRSPSPSSPARGAQTSCTAMTSLQMIISCLFFYYKGPERSTTYYNIFKIPFNELFCKFYYPVSSNYILFTLITISSGCQEPDEGADLELVVEWKPEG